MEEKNDLQLQCTFADDPEKYGGCTYIKYRVLSVRSCRWMCRISTSFASLQDKQFLIPGKTMHVIYEYTHFFQ